MFLENKFTKFYAIPTGIIKYLLQNIGIWIVSKFEYNSSKISPFFTKLRHIILSGSGLIYIAANR